LAGLATGAQVTALGSPLQASAYTAPPTAAQNATAVRTELSTELGRLDAAVSTRLAAANYTEPPTAQEIAVQVEVAIINEDDGRQVIKAIADKIKAEEVTATVIAETVRQEIERTGGMLQTMDIDMDKVIANQGVINTGVRKASLLVPHGGTVQA